MYFREYVCRFSRKLHYFCILGVSHLKGTNWPVGLDGRLQIIFDTCLVCVNSAVHAARTYDITMTKFTRVISNGICVNNIPLFQGRRNNAQGATQHRADVCRTQRQKRTMKVLIFKKLFVNNVAVIYCKGLQFIAE